jgi:predicted nucleic acid-binding protein
MSSVYIETTVVGNIAGRLHPNPAIAERQKLTRTWWSTASDLYQLYISQLTLDECGDGHVEPASERLELIKDLPIIDATEAAEALAALLVQRLAVPASQPRDALHIAIAAIHKIEFIATWNFKHILNPHLQTRIAATCTDAGYRPPVICTPQQLLETES